MHARGGVQAMEDKGICDCTKIKDGKMHKNAAAQRQTHQDLLPNLTEAFDLLKESLEWINLQPLRVRLHFLPGHLTSQFFDPCSRYNFDCFLSLENILRVSRII